MHNEDRAGRADDGQDGRRAGRRADDEAPGP